MRTAQDNPIARLLFGRTRAAVLGLIYARPDDRFYVREISRKTSISSGAIQRELQQLLDAGLMTRTRVGLQVFYQANSSNPVFPEIRALVAKTIGLFETLRSALEPIAKDIRVAFVYGSCARFEESATSDIDLMIIGDVSFDEVLSTLSDAQLKLGREINPTTFTAREFRRKIKACNHFLACVMQGEKYFLIGTENEAID